MIDHKFHAERVIERTGQWAETLRGTSNTTDQVAADQRAIANGYRQAQVHATLYLAEQQRIVAEAIQRLYEGGNNNEN